MDFIVHDSTLNQNPATRTVYERLRVLTEASARSGRCFYKYPLWDQAHQYIPDIVVLDAEYGLLAIDVRPFQLSDINLVNDGQWTVGGSPQDSPLLNLEDFVEELGSQFRSYRALRRVTVQNFFICLPEINREAFRTKFPDADIERLLFEDYLELDYQGFWPDRSTMTGEVSELFLAIAQGDATMNTGYSPAGKSAKSTSMGETIKLIDQRIRSLDISQLKPEIQVPDGPQRLRGLAGTGKTVILAKRAAMLHNLNPNATILYAFHTQSLYNLIKKFIEDAFPRGSSVTGKTKKIDWSKLLIRHAFGGRTTREGVYYRACLRNSIQPQHYDGNLDLVCKDLLNRTLVEEFDYVLIDEAQDLPPSFFQLIWKITKSVDPKNPKSAKRIIFAYDELQSLTSNLDIKDTSELFGLHPDGSPRVDFSAGSYGDGIEMDYVLKKTYRNPFEILMVAHGLGLGLYNKSGEMQMTDKRTTWEAIGYSVEGEFRPGQTIKLTRDPNDSRNLVHEIYGGAEPILRITKCANREEERLKIHDSIVRDINEGVKPEDIVVISLETTAIDEKFRPLQHALWKSGIQSIIPGVAEVQRDRFNEPGKITLSTVFKVKGNEAFIVYIMYFDYLYRRLDFVNVRNRAFTSLSRTKGWCRIYGVGPEMDRASEEIEKIKFNLPSFEFPYPPPEKIKRSLSREEVAQHYKKRKGIKSALLSLKEDRELISESEAVEALQTLKTRFSPEELRRLLGDSVSDELDEEN
jgi:superfamily I DNA and RNA helicase